MIKRWFEKLLVAILRRPVLLIIREQKRPGGLLD